MAVHTNSYLYSFTPFCLGMMDGKTRREYVKNLIRDLNLENPGVKDRFFHAVLSGNIPGWPSPSSDSRGSEKNKEGKEDNHGISHLS